MDHIILDSDCEIEEQNISTITIADDEDDERSKEVGVEVIETDTEEGEVVEATASLPFDSIPLPTAPIPTAETSSERQPIFEVKFPKKTYFQEFGHKVISALEAALNVAAAETFEFFVDESNDDVSIRALMAISEPPNCQSPYHIQESANREQSMSPDLSDLGTLFMIDTSSADKLDTVQVPSYKRTIKDMLDDESSQRKKNKPDDEDKCQRPKRAAAACFNCGSTEHSIRDCTKQRNMKRINKAKKSFSTKQERYHVDIEQRFDHLRPGVVSDKLQAALGLRRGELPFFFYRMRVLGYPPGWLEESKVAHSGIALFNSDGTAVLKSDEDEGEVDGINHKYDASKIIGFPGFNIDPGTNFYDDYKHHNVPPINPTQMKDEYIKSLGANIVKGYKRKKLKNLPAVNDSMTNDATALEMADMEIEDSELAPEGTVIFTRPLPPAESPPPNDNEARPPPPPTEAPPTPPTPVEDSSSSASGERSQSPTLADLEAQQEKLLEQLQSNTSNYTECEDSLIDEVLALEDTQTDLDKSSILPPEEYIKPVNSPSTPTTPASGVGKREDIIMESHMGTPLLKFSPFEQLPAGDNFKVGVSDVINFENLPDSTGKYEQMKMVIKKVRNVITKLHSEND